MAFRRAPWLVMVLLCATAAGAQTTESNPWFVRGGVTPAFILPTNPFPSSPPSQQIDKAPSVTLEVGRRTDGSSEWHELYGMPSYGFGFSLTSFRNGIEHARPVEAYAFFSWPFASFTRRLDLTADFGTGVSWNWKRVNEQSGSSQDVLGSNLNARIDVGFYLRYLLSPRNEIYAGVDFTHRSNGGMVQPDLGINVLGPKVMMQYNLGKFGPEIPTAYDVHPPPGFHPSWDIILGGSGGVKNVVEITGRHDFGAFEGTAAAQWHFYRFGRIAMGTDLLYDGSADAITSLPVPGAPLNTGGPWSLGLYGGYEHIIGRFSAFLHVGYEVARGLDDPDVSRCYQRFGWRYQMTDRIFATFAVRATEIRRADALEVGAGVRLPWLDSTGASGSRR
jgi:lipid A 3-O-deacylase PagL